MALRFWPYEELVIEKFSTVDGEYRITTPWQSSKIQTNRAGVAAAEILMADPSRYPLELRIEAATRLFTSFAKEPLCYTLPRPAAALGKDLPMLRKTCGPAAESVELAIEWDLTSTLDLARITQSDSFDPMTLFSIFRRYFHLDVHASGHLKLFYQRLNRLNSTSSKARVQAAFILRQNLYVTKKCEVTLSTALPLAMSADEVLSNFIKAELGHDLIIFRALKSVTKEKYIGNDDTIPDPSVVKLMEHFLVCAKTNLLAFAFAVFIFERNDQSGESPIAAAFQKAGFLEAAHLLNFHQKINDSGQHEAIAYDLIADMSAVSIEYATQAFELTAQLTQLFLKQVEVLNKILD